MTNNERRKSFTLIELLVVLALVAILSVVVVMTLNPAELLKQARDSNRLSDISTLNTSLGTYETDVTSGFMGTSSIVYISIPDNSSSTCGSVSGLPSLPSGWSYRCSTAQNLRNTDGTGWIPVNFQRISFGSPLSQLPIDPQNTTSTSYYSYTTGGSFKVAATNLESQKYLAQASIDGGLSSVSYEMGSNLALAPGFFTFCPASVSYGGETYGAILAGSRCWMSRNLNIGTRIAGTSEQANNGILEKYCFSDSDANCTTYGGLYQWDEAVGYVSTSTEGGQGICPLGWHVPTRSEQHSLTSAYSYATSTCPLSGTGWYCEPAGTALRSGGVSGLNFLLGGDRTNSGTFVNSAYATYVWSSTFVSANPWLLGLISGNIYALSHVNNSRVYGFSVRCIKN